MSEGIQAIQLRIAEIQQRFAPWTPSAADVKPSSGSTTAFDDALERAQSNLSTDPANTKAIGKYENGRIPPSLLAPIGVGDNRLRPEAAQGFTRMLRDAKSQGIEIGVNDSYRSYDEQVDMQSARGCTRTAVWRLFQLRAHTVSG